MNRLALRGGFMPHSLVLCLGVNTVIFGGDVILESPVHPVTEGDPLTLRCLCQNCFSAFSADFYKDGSLLQSQTTGEMTIPAVSKAHEGLYKCRHPELGESPESRIMVIGSPFPVLRLVCILLMISLYLVGTSILVVKCFRSNRRSQVEEEETNYELSEM
ncbi:Fc receptor-like A [Sardina pilchardus]|uniref:Fc receptor-like A n=1 Tax=Sardina pilchardus TaxID=27697 RepID=UPI002E102E84